MAHGSGRIGGFRRNEKWGLTTCKTGVIMQTIQFEYAMIQTGDGDEYIGKVPSRESQVVGLRQGTPGGMDFGGRRERGKPE